MSEKAMLYRAVARLTLWLLLALLISQSLLWAVTDSELRDFGSFAESGRAMAAGMDPYEMSDAPSVRIPMSDGSYEDRAPNLNPPISLVVFRMLANLNPYAARAVWLWMALGLYVVAIGVLAWTYPAIVTPSKMLWALSLGGLWHAINLGQIYTVLLLFVVGAWLALQEHKWILAGSCIGLLVAIKPNFILWPILLFLAGYWSAALIAALVIGLLGLIPILLYGPSIYLQWFEAATNMGIPVQWGNSSLSSIFARFGVEQLGMAISVILLILLCVWVRHSRPNISAISTVSLAGAILAAPIAWGGYTIFMAPYFLSRRWTFSLTLSAIILCVPAIMVFEFHNMSFPLSAIGGSMYGWAILIVLGHILFDLDGIVEPQRTNIQDLQVS